MSRFHYPDMSALANFMGVTDGFSEATIEEFEAKTERDFSTIRPWLPGRVKVVIDIGAGLGGVDILICKTCRPSAVHVIDGDGTAEKRASFCPSMEAWADRSIARLLIKANVPQNCRVYDHPPDVAATIPADLIISLKSWGHHYPVGIYLALAQRSLRPNGRIVMDIRKRRGDGVSVMQDGGFRWLGKSYETPKCERMVFCRETDT